jgi:hypothetical protein
MFCDRFTGTEGCFGVGVSADPLTALAATTVTGLRLFDLHIRPSPQRGDHGQRR